LLFVNGKPIAKNYTSIARRVVVQKKRDERRYGKIMEIVRKEEDSGKERQTEKERERERERERKGGRGDVYKIPID